MTSKLIGARTMRENPITQKLTDRVVVSATGGMGTCWRSARSNPSTRIRKSNVGARDPRFFALLTEDQIRISERIARGFHLRTTGLGVRTQTYSWQPSGTSNAEDWQFDLMRRFTLWATAVQEAGLSLAAVLDVIVFGKSCRAVDRARRKRNGYVRAQILEALELYEKI